MFDFDERQVLSIQDFAAKNNCENIISSRLYNVIDPMPERYLGAFDAFHINPPWGQYNAGQSVVVFLERGASLVKSQGFGVVVVGDDSSSEWTDQVLQKAQASLIDLGFVIQEMIPEFHSYHLDDAPNLRSCVVVSRRIEVIPYINAPMPRSRFQNFYGREKALSVRYIRVRGKNPLDPESITFECLSNHEKE